MSGQIKMSPAELQLRAKDYGSGAEQITTVLNKLESLQSDLRLQWEGKAFNSFDQQFEELRPKVNNFSLLLQEIQQQLEKTANAMEEQDQALSQNFGLR